MSDFYSIPKSLFREDWLSFDSSQQLDILLILKKMSDCSKAISQSLNLTHIRSPSILYSTLLARSTQKYSQPTFLSSSVGDAGKTYLPMNPRQSNTSLLPEIKCLPLFMGRSQAASLLPP